MMVEMTIVISEQKQEDQPYLWHENYYIVQANVVICDTALVFVDMNKF